MSNISKISFGYRYIDLSTLFDNNSGETILKLTQENVESRSL